MKFLLCGSSARKLKREHANMLGGRAWRYELYPLVYKEIPDFDLLRAFNHGLLPNHYLSSDYKKSLNSYIINYFKEEIQAEGYDRNLSNFSRFLDAVSFQIGELVNFTNISSDCGVSSRTIKEYYQILIDTFLGFYLYPFVNSPGRNSIISAPKFYFFDIGLGNSLSKQYIRQLKGPVAGKNFENFIFMELKAFNSYFEKYMEINFWRTKSGLEVDFIINKGQLLIETKISGNINKNDLKGLIALASEIKTGKMLVVCNEKRKRIITLDDSKEIFIYPWREFLDGLWNNKII